MELQTTDKPERRGPVYCRRCLRELTHPQSYAAGIGPECSERWGVCQAELARLNMDMDPNLVAAAMDDGPSIIRLSQDGTKLGLRFRYDVAVMAQVKTIKGSWWDGMRRLWTIPATKAGLVKAMEVLPQARIYIKDLERIKAIMENGATPEATAAAPKEKPKAWLSDNTIVAKFEYDVEMVEKVKTLPGRRWLKEKKVWAMPVSMAAITALAGWGFEFDAALKAKAISLAPAEVGELDLPEGAGLYPFQKIGVEFLESRRGRGLVADEMGLGKTIQALMWLRIHPEARPAVVVVPASLKLNWRKEARKWLDPRERVIIVNGKPNGNADLPGEGDVIVINYDILPDITGPDPNDRTGKKRVLVGFGWWKHIKKFKPQALIIDECHMIKNHKAQRTQAVRDLARGIPHVIALSGTPIINRPIEFYNAINLIRPELFPSWWDFTQRFCGRTRTRFGTDVSGSTNTDELHRILTETIMIRRLKRDVLAELPAKIRSVLPLEMTNRREYNQAASDFLGWLEQREGVEAADRAAGAEALVAIGKLKQLAAKGKMAAAKSWISDVLESGEKLILFAVHHWVIDEIMEEFAGRAVRLTGKENQEQRQEAVDRFQSDDSIRLFVGNVKAAGVGITLTAATQVAFLELGWSPGEHDQAEDRAHRIGQEEVVNITYLVAEGTVEEEIAQLIDEKRAVLASVLDGRQPEKTEMLKELLARMRARVGK
jgi:SWI/SNF-related matrix-associated actin-dependent regulator of chromatin subfamily A-like protein 1